MRLPYKDGMAIVRKGMEYAQEEHLYALYVACYPSFNSETYISWGDFLKASKIPKYDAPRHSKDEILDKVKGYVNLSFVKGD